MDCNIIISISSILIAITALAVAIWQGLITRKHNQLSVKPIGDILANNFEDKIQVVLENKGIGPLQIKSFKAIVGKESKSNVIDWMPPLPDGIPWTNWLKDFEGTYLKPLESITLIEFTLDSSDEKQREARDNIRKSLAQVCIKFDYTDIYDNQFIFPLHCLSNVFEQKAK